MEREGAYIPNIISPGGGMHNTTCLTGIRGHIQILNKIRVIACNVFLVKSL